MVNCWILVGNEESWKTAFDKFIWGIKKIFKNRWELVKKDDLLFFYATYPIRGIIGYGIVKEKLIGKNLVWEDEKKEKKIIFPYRILFDRNKERKEIIKVSPYETSLMAGINLIKNERVIKKLLDWFDINSKI